MVPDKVQYDNQHTKSTDSNLKAWCEMPGGTFVQLCELMCSYVDGLPDEMTPEMVEAAKRASETLSQVLDKGSNSTSSVGKDSFEDTRDEQEEDNISKKNVPVIVHNGQRIYRISVTFVHDFERWKTSLGSKPLNYCTDCDKSLEGGATWNEHMLHHAQVTPPKSCYSCNLHLYGRPDIIKRYYELHLLYIEHKLEKSYPKVKEMLDDMLKVITEGEEVTKNTFHCLFCNSQVDGSSDRHNCYDLYNANTFTCGKCHLRLFGPKTTISFITSHPFHQHLDYLSR